MYRWICKRLVPGGMTLSAYALILAVDGRPWWRNRIDGFCLLFFGQHRHCRHHYRRETRSTINSPKAP